MIIYVIGVLVCLVVASFVAGLAGEMDPDAVPVILFLSFIWPAVIALSPFVGIYFLGRWIGNRCNS